MNNLINIIIYLDNEDKWEYQILIDSLFKLVFKIVF